MTTPKSLHIRSINSLHDLKINLTEVPLGICAVVGDNGAGKTTFLECMLPAPVWLDMPTRPGRGRDSFSNLFEYTTGRDGLIDMVQEYMGREYRHLITIDTGPNAKSVGELTAHLYIDGKPANNGKARTYREAVKRHLPQRELMMASAFSAQGGQGSFAKMDKAGRRSLFRTMLGLDHLQRLSERAAKHRKELDAQAGTLDRDGRRLDEDVARASELTRSIETMGERLPELRAKVEQAKADYISAQAAHATAAALLEQLDTARSAAVRRRRALEASREDHQRRRTQAADQLSRAERVLSQEQAIQAAVGRLAEAKRAHMQAIADYREHNAELKRLTTEADSRKRRLTVAESRKRRAAECLLFSAEADDNLVRYEVDADLLKAAQAKRPALSAEVVRTVKQHRIASDKLNDEKRAAGRELDRTQTQIAAATTAAAQLDDVPCSGRKWVTTYGSADDAEMGDGDRADCSTCPMLTSASAAKARLPELEAEILWLEALSVEVAKRERSLDALRKEADEATHSLGLCDREISKLAGADTRLQQAEEAIASRERWTADLKAAEEEIATLGPKAEADAIAKAQASRDKAEAAGRAASEAITQDGDVDEQLADLQRAKGRVPLLRDSIDRHEKGERDATAELETISVPADPETQRETVRQKKGVSSSASEHQELAQEDLERLVVSLAGLRGKREALGDIEERAAALGASRELVATRRAGLVLIERAFGAEGIQALEIDAAGPGVSDLCNELLQAMGCHLTVQLRTIREKTARRKQAEVFDILVHNSRTMKTLELAKTSGGETVLVEEAIKLAISVHVAQRMGGIDTIWRDECDGALSDAWAKRYPAMLRAACDLGGLSRCYLITHRPDVAMQADSVLVISDGEATLMHPSEYAETINTGA